MLGLIVVTGATVAGLCYRAVIEGDGQAVTTMGTIATLGIGGLLALAGAKKEDQ